MRHMLPCSGDTWKEPQTAEKVLFFFFQRDTKQFLSRQPKHCFVVVVVVVVVNWGRVALQDCVSFLCTAK